MTVLGLEKPSWQRCRMDKVGVVEGEETLRKTCVVRGERMRAWGKWWECKFVAIKPRAWIYKKITLERNGYKWSASLKLVPWTLTSMAKLVKRCSPKPKVTDLIPGRVHSEVAGSVPSSGRLQGPPIDLSLLQRVSFLLYLHSLPSLSKAIKINQTLKINK